MIRFYDVENTANMAQATLKRSTGVNGSKTITGEIIAGNAVINGIGRGWSLVFEDEPYIITYTKFNDQTNSVEFDAIQKFFWDFAKSGFYQEWNGSHAFTDYLDALFKNTGYEYILEANVAAFEKENWGMKNRLALFNDVISQAGVEFELIGKRVKITNSIGSDLSTIVRKGFNLSDMVKESSITDFVTYGKGFGAFNDSNDQSKGRLEVEYRSPLADIYGALEADPLVDERYTIADSLLAAVKSKVDNSVAISIDLKIYDLPDADFTYQVPQSGDWIMAIDEAIGFSRRIRVINVDEEFDVNGQRIDYTATCGDLPIAVQQELAQSGQAHKIEQLTNDVDAAAISANGKNTNYYGSAEPSQPREGDLWYKKNGDDTELYVWANGRWEIVVSKNTSNIIDQKVDSKLVQLNADMSTADENLKSAKQDIADLQVKLKDNDDTQAQLTKDLSENSTILEKAQADIVANANGLTELDAKLKANDDAQAQLQDDLAANTKVQDQLKKDLSDNTELMNQVKTDTTNSLEKVNENLTQAKSDAAQAVKHVDKAVANAQSAADASGLSATSAQAASDAALAAKNLATSTANSFATVQAQSQTAAVNATTALGQATTAVVNASDALTQAKSALATANTVQTSMQPAITAAVDTAKGELTASIQTVKNTIDGIGVGAVNLAVKATEANGWINASGSVVSSDGVARTTDFIKIESSGNYVLQYWYQGGHHQWLGWTFYDSEKTFINYISNGESDPETSDFYLCIKFPNQRSIPNNTTYIRISYYEYSGEGKIQFEKGTIATSFSVAPEDVQSQITTNSTDITANSKLIAASATQESVNTLTQQVTTNTAQLKLTATEANLKLATNAVDALTGRVKTAEGNITATSDALKAVYTKSETTNLLGGYATQTWAQQLVTVTANGLEANLSTLKANVDNMQVGGRNLHVASTEADGYWDDKGGLAGIGNANDSRAGDFISITPTNDYILQYWLDEAVASGIKGWVGYTFWDKDKKFISYYTSREGVYDYKLITFSGRIPSNAAYIKVSYYRQKGKGRVKLEEGTLATDWSPAPEDTATYTDTKVAELKLTVDGLSTTFAKQTDLATTASNLKVTADGLNLLTTVTGTNGEKVTQVIADVNSIQTTMTGAGGYTSRIQTLEGFQNTAKDDIKGLQTQQTTIAGQYTSLIGGLGQTNLVYNSEVKNDTEGWSTNNSEFTIGVGTNQFDAANGSNSLSIHAKSATVGSWYHVNSKPFTPVVGQTYSASAVLFITGSDAPTATFVAMVIDFYDANGNRLDHSTTNFDISNPWEKQTLVSSGIVTPSTASSMMFSIWFNGAINLIVNHPMLVADEKVGIYQPDTVGNSQITQLQNQIDLRTTVAGKVTAALNLSNDGGGTVTIRGASLYVTAASHFDTASIQSAAIANLDATKITSGSISSDRLTTTKLNADNITSGSISSDRLATTKLNADNITSGKINADLITTGTLSADMIVGGTFDASKMTVKNINAGSITSGSIAAKRLSTTKLNADNITSGTIAAERLAATKISATNIVGGTFDAGTMTVKRLSADMIATGTLDVSKLTAVKNFSASNIIGGTLDASTMTVKKLSASSITGGTIDGDNVNVVGLNADNITSGSIAAERLAATKISATNIVGGTLDASTMTVKKLSASSITGGTINGANVNVIGLNASAITTGTIKGANLAINLNSGQVVFQSGRIHSTKNNIDINVDKGYMSVADSTSRVLLKGGQLQFIQPQLFDLQKTPYLSISNNGVGSNWAGATIVGRDSIMLANSANVGFSIYTWELGKNTFSGLISGKNSDGVWEPTIVGGADRGVVIVGGSSTDTIGAGSPYIRVGSNVDGSGTGLRVFVDASTFTAPCIYNTTGSTSPNVYVTAAGTLQRSTSATKYKTSIERSRSTEMGETLIQLPTAKWLDKAEMARYASGEQTTPPKFNFGMIAEDLAAAGLEDLVARGVGGQLEGINYDRIAPALLPLLAKMKQEIEELKGEK